MFEVGVDGKNIFDKNQYIVKSLKNPFDYKNHRQTCKSFSSIMLMFFYIGNELAQPTLNRILGFNLFYKIGIELFKISAIIYHSVKL